MSMSTSSTAFARKNTGVPFERTITKSEIVDHSTRHFPAHDVDERAPTRRRVCGSEPSAACPRPARAARCSGGEIAAAAVVAGRAGPRASPARCARAPRPRCRSTRTRRRASSRRCAAARYSSKRALWRYGPSSQSRPTQRSTCWICSIDSSVERATSVSSMRRMNVPPMWRACNQLNSAVRMLPMCRKPVGAGEKRKRISGSAWTLMTAGASRSRPAGSGSCPRRSA